MTLLATTLVLSVQTLSGSALDVGRQMSGQLGAVVLSFAISGAYWMSQQQRLALTRSVTSWQTRLHLIFLFLIVLLPISTSIFGRSGTTQAAVTIYGTHLVLIARPHLLLWIDVHRRVAARGVLASAGLIRRGPRSRRTAARVCAMFLVCRLRRAATHSPSCAVGIRHLMSRQKATLRCCQPVGRVQREQVAAPLAVSSFGRLRAGPPEHRRGLAGETYCGWLFVI